MTAGKLLFCQNEKYELNAFPMAQQRVTALEWMKKPLKIAKYSTYNFPCVFNMIHSNIFHVRRKTFIEPKFIPPRWTNEITKPLSETKFALIIKDYTTRGADFCWALGGIVCNFKPILPYFQRWGDEPRSRSFFGKQSKWRQKKRSLPKIWVFFLKFKSEDQKKKKKRKKKVFSVFLKSFKSFFP